MSFVQVIVGIVILHFLIGFGWVLYKLAFEKTDPEKKEPGTTDNEKPVGK